MESDTHLQDLDVLSIHVMLVQVCFVHICLVQVTILKLVWRSQRADPPRCAPHFPTDICSVIQEGEIFVEKCVHRGASACQEHHTLSLGRNKHGHNNSALCTCRRWSENALPTGTRSPLSSVSSPGGSAPGSPVGLPSRSAQQ